MVYLFSLIKILQTNVVGGNQNVDENTEDDFKEEDDSDGSQKENTDSDDDWFSNIYVFKFGEGYYSFQVDVLIFCILFCRRFNIFYCIMHFLDFDNYGFGLKERMY